ncbi:hypothetical protein BT69DRAFT_1355678 [Atractiella rhizophila]|nr:hypothetical protein BT69DRAFT_1355678 [Atractiella rhizophila]
MSATSTTTESGWLSFMTGGSPGLVPFETKLEQLTSANLPANTPPNLLESLELSDLIRSNSISPPAAWRAFRKKLTHTNPNVVILGLKVLDVCVKNSGDGFLKEVGGKGGADEFENVIKSPTTHHEVQALLLSLFQTWALAFKAKAGLSNMELVNTYHRLVGEGIKFPPKDSSATGALIDSMSAPEWKDSDLCTRCRTPFTFTNRKHHCRNCGDIFDQQCSSHSMELPHFGVTEKVRVCDGCWRKLGGGGRRASISSTSPSSFTPSQSARPLSMHIPRSSTVTASTFGHRSSSSVKLSRRQQEEEDMRRAIEASLKDTGSTSRKGYIPSSSYPGDQWSGRREPPVEVESTGEDEDADFMAAIKASLEETQKPQPSAPPTLGEEPPSHGQHQTYKPIPSYDLEMNERDAMLTFSQVVETSKAAGRNVHDSLRRAAPNGTDLYQKSLNVRPKLARGIDDAQRKWEVLMEMNNKLTEAVKMYDRILEEQINRNATSAYASHLGHQPVAYAPQTYSQPQSPPAPQPTSFAPSQQATYAPSQPYPQNQSAPIQDQRYAPAVAQYQQPPYAQPSPQQTLPQAPSAPVEQYPTPAPPITGLPLQAEPTNYPASTAFSPQQPQPSPASPPLVQSPFLAPQPSYPQAYQSPYPASDPPTSPVTVTSLPAPASFEAASTPKPQTPLDQRPVIVQPQPHPQPQPQPSYAPGNPQQGYSLPPPPSTQTQNLLLQLPHAPSFPIYDTKVQLEGLPAAPTGHIWTPEPKKEEAPLIEF